MVGQGPHLLFLVLLQPTLVVVVLGVMAALPERVALEVVAMEQMAQAPEGLQRLIQAVVGAEVVVRLRQVGVTVAQVAPAS